MSIVVTDVRACPLAVPCIEPYHWRSGRQEGINVTLISVETDAGITGYGEVTLDHPQAAMACIGKIARHVVGRPPGNVEAIIGEVMAHGRWRHTYRFTNAVLAAIETACWDVWGKGAEPAGHCLLRRPRTKRGGFLRFPARELGRGGRGAGASARRRRLRRHLVDANGAWDVPTAIDQIGKMARYEIDWVEQPVDLQNISGLAKVRRSVEPKIAADQAVYSIGELRSVLEAEAADVVVLGHHESGGLWRLRQMAQIADAHGIPLNRHGTLETSISTYAALQVLASIPNLTSGHQIMHQLLTTERLSVLLHL